MGLRELGLKNRYRSNTDGDIGISFIAKALTESCVYKRAVGFFSSSSLISISRGLSPFISKPNCHIYLVVSPFLSKEDVDAINKGYSSRESTVEKAILRQFNTYSDIVDCERLNLLSHLIEENILDIKVAFMDDGKPNSIGMYHEKFGVFEDELGDSVAFDGSLNESENSYDSNFERVHVYKSWEDPEDVKEIKDDFDNLWNDTTNKLRVIDFPKAAKEKLFSYRKDKYIKNIDQFEKEQRDCESVENSLPSYHFPYPLYDFQKKAINNWAHQGFRGLFDMGTGTGKTVTAYTAAVSLLKRVNYRLATIVVCPYKHLVEQWLEDQHWFNISFIVGDSDNKYKNYESDLHKAIQDFNDGILPYFYFITTNASYRTEKVQNLLNQIKGNVLFIGDEVHNFGAEGLKISLNPNFKFRLGLSATIDRHNDEEGTQAIYDYFGKPCIHYGLKEAIQSGVLTRYYYYVVPVYLTEDEQNKYIELTNQIRKNSYFDKNGKAQLSAAGKFYALQRARVIATARNKVSALKEVMTKFSKEHNILVYCGTGKVEDKDTGEEERQIDQVCKVLGFDLNMKVQRYTSLESTDERKQITERFTSGDLQAIVAIKCLDEGVNIPSIKYAFILASSTNPREYIQRRGRVLRKFEGKKYSYIFDFATLPFPIKDYDNYDIEYSSGFRALIKNEISRIKEFSSLAENEHESDALISELTDAFKLDEYETETFEKIEWSDEND